MKFIYLFNYTLTLKRAVQNPLVIFKIVKGKMLNNEYS